MTTANTTKTVYCIIDARISQTNLEIMLGIRRNIVVKANDETEKSDACDIGGFVGMCCVLNRCLLNRWL
jgi:hypothetical protein